MESNQIIVYPDKRLLEKSEPIKKFDDETLRVAGVLVDYMNENRCVGVASIQLGIVLRMFAILPNLDDEDAKPIIVVNPKIVKTSGSVTDDESCLSLPDVWIRIERAKVVEVEGFDEYGKKETLKFKGYLTRGLLHEIDHLDGRLMWDYLPDDERRKEIEKYLKRVCSRP